MKFDKAYPDTFTISEVELKGQRNMSKGKVLIPYTEEPDVGIGDVISQKLGKREILLKVLDVSLLEDGSLGVGTKHPHMLTLQVKNSTAEPHLDRSDSQTINIGSLSGQQVQVGNKNSQVANIDLKQLVEYVADSDDPEAKATLRSLLQNSTVASVVGAGVSALLGML